VKSPGHKQISPHSGNAGSLLCTFTDYIWRKRTFLLHRQGFFSWSLHRMLLLEKSREHVN